MLRGWSTGSVVCDRVDDPVGHLHVVGVGVLVDAGRSLVATGDVRHLRRGVRGQPFLGSEEPAQARKPMIDRAEPSPTNGVGDKVHLASGRLQVGQAAGLVVPSR